MFDVYRQGPLAVCGCILLFVWNSDDEQCQYVNKLLNTVNKTFSCI